MDKYRYAINKEKYNEKVSEVFSDNLEIESLLKIFSSANDVYEKFPINYYKYEEFFLRTWTFLIFMSLPIELEKFNSSLLDAEYYFKKAIEIDKENKKERESNKLRILIESAKSILNDSK